MRWIMYVNGWILLLINSLKREGFVSYGLMEGGLCLPDDPDACNPGGGVTTE